MVPAIQQKAFFLGSGPNWNSSVEQAILEKNLISNGLDTQFYHSTHLDLEFEDRRDDIEYRILKLFKANGPIVLIVHGNSVHFVLSLIQERPHLFKSLILIGPSFDLEYLEEQFIKIAALSSQELKRKVDVDSLNYFLWFDKEYYYRYMSFLSNQHLKLEHFTMIENFVSEEKVKKVILIPTLMIFGEQDLLCSMPKTISFAQGKFAKFKVHPISESGHYPHIEKVKEFVTCLIEFLNFEVHNQKQDKSKERSGDKLRKEVQTQIIS